MKNARAWRVTVAAVVALAAPLALMQPAGAETAPELACGSTQPGPCQETAHFSDINDMETPAPPGGGCPAFLSTDFFTFVATGNGVEHINVNKAQDGWFTTTFTGSVTITAYLNGTVDEDGNATSVSDPDPNVPPLTGRITEWFGGSFNKQNSVFHGTINITGAYPDGTTLGVHFVTHQSWTPGSGETPHTTFDKITCT